MTNNVFKSGILGSSRIFIGRFTYGFDNVFVRQWNEGASLSIGSFCSISSNITIYLGGNHRTDWITTFPFGHIFQDELGGQNIKGHPATKGDVVIGNDVWIGAGVTIMSGITIGDGAVLSTNANVTKNVEPYEIVGGNPAKFIKKRFDDDVINLLLKLKWWDLPLEEIIKIEALLCSKPDKKILLEIISNYQKI